MNRYAVTVLIHLNTVEEVEAGNEADARMVALADVRARLERGRIALDDVALVDVLDVRPIA